MRCEFGYCIICDKEIARKCTSCDTRKPTNNYTEVQVEWSNGAKMQIGICLECATSHKWVTPEAKEGITKAHWEAWDKMNHTYDRGIVIV